MWIQFEKCDNKLSIMIILISVIGEHSDCTWHWDCWIPVSNTALHCLHLAPLSSHITTTGSEMFTFCVPNHQGNCLKVVFLASLVPRTSEVTDVSILLQSGSTRTLTSIRSGPVTGRMEPIVVCQLFSLRPFGLGGSLEKQSPSWWYICLPL